MEQKRVSFKVAKAIKEAGYPQEENNAHYVAYDDDIYFHDWEEKECAKWSNMYASPTYLEVWLWLWKVKKIAIDAKEYNGVWSSVFVCTYSYLSAPKTNPEEAIIAAIDYLVNNNLIK